jgi:D-arabinose 1-dehydrogenase-like Zn-dependent alcohol dehydrogenase
MPKMRAVPVSAPGGSLDIVVRDIPDVVPGSVRIKVEACGICHSDSLTRDGGFPGLTHPRIPGHEVVGVIDAVAADVRGWKPGQRVGVGWHGGACGYCENCRRGDGFACQTATRITGVTQDGGYAEYITADQSALAKIPDGITAVEAAPLMCAGVTTFNALRHAGAGPGELVAVLGLGGLGHLAVQFSAKMGYRTVGIARGRDKEPLARKLGASEYIDTQSQDPAEALQNLGGAKVILATVTAGDAMAAAVGGLGINGTMMLIGAAGPMQISPLMLLAGKRAVKGWYSGTSIDSEDTLAFSVLTGVRSMNEEIPFDKVKEGYERMMSGKARFRVVLKIAS